MAVYVDPLIPASWRYSFSSHLYADDLDELHEFAGKLRLKREWFHDRKGFPHYDITASKRNKAVKRGAMEHTRKQLVEWLRRRRTE